ncbi:hypothetical protein [Nitrosospira sp. NpAV]|nr:hypothetical protein [Nitrosospira sp. NpAV]
MHRESNNIATSSHLGMIEIEQAPFDGYVPKADIRKGLLAW